MTDQHLRTEIRTLGEEIRRLNRDRDKVINKYHDMRAVLEKITHSTSLKEAVAMAASILKQVALDSTIIPPPPPPAPTPKKRGPKTKDSKATLGDFL